MKFNKSFAISSARAYTYYMSLMQPWISEFLMNVSLNQYLLILLYVDEIMLSPDVAVVLEFLFEMTRFTNTV